MKNKNLVLGVVLIIIGILIFLGSSDILNINFNIFDVGKYWPLLFLVLPGLIFHYAYFAKTPKDPGLLVPGGILLTIGIVCQLSTSFDLWGVLWPGYILAVAVGLFELYIFGNREKGLLIPVGILGGLSLIFFVSFSFGKDFSEDINKFIIPILLVVIGLIVILANRSGSKQNENKDNSGGKE